MKLTRSHALAAGLAALVVAAGVGAPTLSSHLQGKPVKGSHPVPGKTPNLLTNYWVATTGSDSNNGLTPATAWLTVNKAGQTVTAGAVVHVANGTYTTASTINNSGTAQSHIVFIADNQWGASIQGGASFAVTILGDYVDFKNFDVTATTAVVGVAVEGNHDVVQGNHVHSVGDTGACQPGGGAIDAFPSGAYGTQTAVLIQGNKVDHVGQFSCLPTNFIHGIYTTGTGVQVFSNVVGNVAGYGIQCWHACNAPNISNNTVFNGGQGGIIVGTGDSGVVPQFDYAVMTNNISINNTGWGLREYTYDAGHQGSHDTWVNNHTFGNSSGSYRSEYAVNTDSGTKTTNPALVNYQADGSGNYRTTAAADDVDAGTAIGMAPTDYDGVPRENPPDIGAYEVINS